MQIKCRSWPFVSADIDRHHYPEQELSNRIDQDWRRSTSRGGSALIHCSEKNGKKNHYYQDERNLRRVM
jgi:hypothetical protein